MLNFIVNHQTLRKENTMSIAISMFSGQKRSAAIKAVRKVNALYFAFASNSKAEDPREIVDAIATCLREEKHVDGTIELYVDDEEDDCFFMWVDNDVNFTSVEDWLKRGVPASGHLPNHWELKLPDGDSAYDNVRVLKGAGEAKFEVDLNRPTQRELDRRELHEALHLE